MERYRPLLSSAIRTGSSVGVAVFCAAQIVNDPDLLIAVDFDCQGITNPIWNAFQSLLSLLVVVDRQPKSSRRGCTCAVMLHWSRGDRRSN